jgi:hypothetical protein
MWLVATGSRFFAGLQSVYLREQSLGLARCQVKHVLYLSVALGTANPSSLYLVTAACIQVVSIAYACMIKQQLDMPMIVRTS